MDRQEVIKVLDALANEQPPETAAALHAASAMLKRTAPASAGKSWSGEEDERLAREFDCGTPLAHIALNHGRTRGAITARLVKLGRLDPSTVKPRIRGDG
jgi:hypothetical protein